MDVYYRPDREHGGKWKVFPNCLDYGYYLTLRNRCNVKVRSDRRLFITRLNAKMKASLNYLYRFMTRKKPKSKGICSF